MCNDLPPITQYYPLLTPLNQTSEEVTHPGITIEEVHLTAKF
jgi:hypothetical protein